MLKFLNITKSKCKVIKLNHPCGDRKGWVSIHWNNANINICIKLMEITRYPPERCSGHHQPGLWWHASLIFSPYLGGCWARLCSECYGCGRHHTAHSASALTQILTPSSSGLRSPHHYCHYCHHLPSRLFTYLTLWKRRDKIHMNRDFKGTHHHHTSCHTSTHSWHAKY